MSDTTRTQSTNHIMMMEPVDFHANEETMATNSYQYSDDMALEDIQLMARAEFRAFRDLLVEHGVIVTTTIGQKGCPDDVFCNNWVSTHHGKRMVLYPMLAPNRQTERRPELIEMLKGRYTDIQHFESHEKNGQYLESTGAMCLDRVNRIAYQNLSDRSDRALGALWCDMNDFRHVVFQTEYKMKPVYHADVVMWIGTNLAGICSEALRDRDVIKHLETQREVIEFNNEQMENFCGNSLEVRGHNDELMLVMSKAGFNSLNDGQQSALGNHYKTIITPEIPAIEKYGGGSARCMLLELF